MQSMDYHNYTNKFQIIETSSSEGHGHTSQMSRLKVVSGLQSVIKEKANQTCETWGTNVIL